MTDETRLGPYRLLRELGTGGMGTVYLAETAEPACGLPAGTRVAIKVVHRHLLDTPGFLKRFLREAEIGQRVDHDNVVRTLNAEIGTRNGAECKYLVFEYVEGRDLRALQERLGTVPEGLLREIAVQTSDGLAAIHACDAVHRDIKPDNILITEDHRVRIMDLGVVKLQDATIQLTEHGSFAGSVQYAAPEQFGGGDVGPASDLYSLGVVLYELATGVNPFAGDDAAAVMHAHLSVDPPPPHDRNPDTSPFFSEFISTLLAKDPADRFPDAQAARTALHDGEDGTWWSQRESRVLRTQRSLPRIPVARDTSLHGRENEMEALRTAWQEARTGTGATVLVLGESGLGKTRLLDAFARTLGGGEFHVLYSAYSAGGHGGLSEALRTRFGDADLADNLRPYLGATPELVDPYAASLRQTTASEELLDDKVAQAVSCDLLRGLAAEHPTLCILEDLHHAPPASRRLAAALARAALGHRALVVLTAQPDELDDELLALARHPNAHRVELNRLSPRQVIELLRDAFRSEDLAERLGGKIAYKSDGVPYFVFEMIRMLREERFLRRRADGTWVQSRRITDIEVPTAVRDLILGRLDALTPLQRTIVDVGAVQGLRFDPDLVARVLGERRVRILQELAEIERRSGILRAEAGLLVFDQNQVQDVVYQALLPGLRAEYHMLLADALQQRDEGKADAAFLGYHYLHGADPQRGLPHLEDGLATLARRYRTEDALRLCDRVLEVEGLLDGRRRVEVLLRKVRGLGQLGRLSEHHRAIEEARALAGEVNDPALMASVEHQHGALLLQTSLPDHAIEVEEGALELARRAGARDIEIAVQNTLGLALRRAGRNEDAIAAFRRSAELAAAANDVPGRSKAIGNLGVLLSNSGRVAEGKIELEHALKLAVASEDRRWIAGCLCNLGVNLRRLGDMQGAATRYREAATLARQVGHRTFEANAVGNLGNVYIDLGRSEEALRQHQRAANLQREVDNTLGQATSHISLGDIQLLWGRHDDALAAAETAQSLALAMRDERTLGIVGTLLGRISHARAQHGETRPHFDEAIRALDAVDDAPNGGLARLRLAETLLDNGLASEAAPLLAHASTTITPRLRLLHQSCCARMPDADENLLRTTWDECAEKAPVRDRMQCAFHIGSALQDAQLFAAAAADLATLLRHAPPDKRGAMAAVPLHAAVQAAAE